MAIYCVSPAYGGGQAHPSSFQRTPKYVSLLRISGAFYLTLFEQPVNDVFSQEPP
jgi:hypothetical protein